MPAGPAAEGSSSSSSFGGCGLGELELTALQTSNVAWGAGTRASLHQAVQHNGRGCMAAAAAAEGAAQARARACCAGRPSKGSSVGADPPSVGPLVLVRPAAACLTGLMGAAWPGDANLLPRHSTWPQQQQRWQRLRGKLLQQLLISAQSVNFGLAVKRPAGLAGEGAWYEGASASRAFGAEQWRQRRRQ